MVLPDLVIPSYIGRFQLYSGLDSLEKCFNPKHFLNYPFSIKYKYNERGFRDQSWPTDLDNVIWCLGDSFTVGIGQPFEHTWPQLVSKKLNHPVINVSLDGASNTWIARKAVEIINKFPKAKIIIHWSYIHRRELGAAPGLSDEDRRIWFNAESDLEDLENLSNCIDQIQSSSVLHSFIWNAVPGKLLDKFDHLVQEKNINFLKQIAQVDYGRDYHHYGFATANLLADQMITQV